MLTATSCFAIQVRYAAQEIPAAKSARARGSYLRVSFKNTRETAQAINGMKLQKALTYLENVTKKSMAVPMRRYAGSTGRTAQGESTSNFKLSTRWMESSGIGVVGMIVGFMGIRIELTTLMGGNRAEMLSV